MQEHKLAKGKVARGSAELKGADRPSGSISKTKSSLPEADELGLVPPPANLTAPWATPANQPDKDAMATTTTKDESSDPDEIKAVALGKDVARETGTIQGGEGKVPELQGTDRSDLVLEKALDETVPSDRTTNQSSTDRSPEQTDRSSDVDTHRSLIQASKT